jgi:endonuclease
MNQSEKANIFELLSQGLSSEKVAGRLGIAKGRVAAVKAHMTMGTYQRSADVGGLDVTDLEEVTDAAALKFGLERDMQAALRVNIQQLDPSLRVIDSGKERRVESGFIDILAEDDEGSLVVIELKSGEAPESAMAQILSYIGALEAEEARPVRGMLIAHEFSTRMRLAARAAGVTLIQYGYSFTFTVV